MKALFSAAAALAFALNMPLAARADHYTVVDLGTLGGAGSSGYGINSLGHAVGYARVPDPVSEEHPFLYANGVMTNLGTLGGNEGGARAVNSLDQVTGHVWAATKEARVR
jgi:probable HAF family extracellular repeat protein